MLMYEDQNTDPGDENEMRVFVGELFDLYQIHLLRTNNQGKVVSGAKTEKTNMGILS